MFTLTSNPDGAVLRAPSPEAIGSVIEGLPAGDDSFAILAVDGDDLTYMQAIGNPVDGFTLEYQDGAVDRHFECQTNSLPAEHVILAFRAYARGDPVWKTALPWQPLAL